MNIFLILLICAIILLFALGFYFLFYPIYTLITRRAPFVPIHKDALQHVVAHMASEIQKSEHPIIYDLGCGDARVLLGLHKVFSQAQYHGVENEWFPFLLAKLRTRNIKNISIHWGNFYKKDISDATHIFVYLFPEVMDALLSSLEQQVQQGTRVISYTFAFSHKKPDNTIALPGRTQTIVTYTF